MWNRAEWDDFFEQAMVAVILALVTVGLFAFGGVRGSELALMAGLSLVGLALGMVRLWTSRSPRLLLHPVILPVLAFVGYAAWRATLVEVTYPARRELLLVVMVVLVFWVALHNFYRQEPTQWISHALVTLGALVGAYALIQWVGTSTQVLWLTQPAQYYKRAGGTFINPNHLAGFLSLILPLAMAQIFVGRASAVSKVLYAYSSLMMMGGIAVTMSRGGWVATSLGLLGMFSWLAWRRRELRIPVAIAVVLLMTAGGLFLDRSDKARARIENVNRDGNMDSGMGRPLFWKPAFAMWRDHALFGVGPAQFDVRFPQYRTPRNQINPGWVHNEYLNLLTDYGIVGVALIGAALAALAWGSFRAFKYVERAAGDLGSRNSNRTSVYVGVITGLGSLAVHCLVDFDLHIPVIAVTASLLTALLASHVRHATERFWYTPPVFLRILLCAAAVGVGVWMAPLAWKFGLEGVALNRTESVQEVTPALVEDLTLASVLMPDNARTAYELGENLRRLSFQGDSNWQELAVRAVETLNRAAQLNRFDARIQLSLGQTYRWLNDPEKAEVALQKAAELGPNDRIIANALAWYALQQGKLDEAQRLATQSLEWQWWSNDLAREVLLQVELKKKGQ